MCIMFTYIKKYFTYFICLGLYSTMLYASLHDDAIEFIYQAERMIQLSAKLPTNSPAQNATVMIARIYQATASSLTTIAKSTNTALIAQEYTNIKGQAAQMLQFLNVAIPSASTPSEQRQLDNTMAQFTNNVSSNETRYTAVLREINNLLQSLSKPSFSVGTPVRPTKPVPTTMRQQPLFGDPEFKFIDMYQSKLFQLKAAIITAIKNKNSCTQPLEQLVATIEMLTNFVRNLRESDLLDIATNTLEAAQIIKDSNKILEAANVVLTSRRQQVAKLFKLGNISQAEEEKIRAKKNLASRMSFLPHALDSLKRIEITNAPDTMRRTLNETIETLSIIAHEIQTYV
jgi:hypothetical protein